MTILFHSFTKNSHIYLTMLVLDRNLDNEIEAVYESELYGTDLFNCNISELIISGGIGWQRQLIDKKTSLSFFTFQPNGTASILVCFSIIAYFVTYKTPSAVLFHVSVPLGWAYK